MKLIKKVSIQQHYQTCKDMKCPLFKPEEPEKGCRALETGDCRYQTIHMLQDTYNQCLDGKLHGLCGYWYENGQIEYECNYVNGKKHGVEREWYKGGELMVECDYINGKLHGIYKYWHGGDGQLWEESTYVNGEKHGLSRTWYWDGRLSTEHTYMNGKEV